MVELTGNVPSCGWRPSGASHTGAAVWNPTIVSKMWAAGQVSLAASTLGCPAEPYLSTRTHTNASRTKRPLSLIRHRLLLIRFLSARFSKFVISRGPGPRYVRLSCVRSARQATSIALRSLHRGAADRDRAHVWQRPDNHLPWRDIGRRSIPLWGQPRLCVSTSEPEPGRKAAVRSRCPHGCASEN